MTVYIGIDVHKDFSQVAIVPSELMQGKGKAWEEQPQYRITNCREDFDKLLSLIDSTNDKDISIAIDHTGGHYSAPMVSLLTNAGYDLCYIHPSGLRNFKKGKKELNKTDKIDAAYMARALYYHKTHGDDYHFTLLNPRMGTEAELLSTIITQYQVLTKLKVQTANRLHQMLISTFPEGEKTCFDQLMLVLPLYPSAEAILGAKSALKDVKGVRRHKLAEIQNLAACTIGINSAAYGESIRYLAIEYNSLEIKLKELYQRMTAIVAAHPYGLILNSFPCVSTIAAATLISCIRDIGYFSDCYKLRKELGVAPKIAQSGNGDGRSVVGPGNKLAKKVLFQSCFAMLNPKVPDNDFRDYYKRKKGAGMHGTKALVATMGQLTEAIYHCLKNGEFYEYQGQAKKLAGNKSSNFVT